MANLYRVEANGKWIAAVYAVRAVYAGDWWEEAKDILTPDRDAVRAALPHYWRKAFDRTTFWHIDGQKTPYCTLYSTRGRRLATISCVGYVFA